jgi:hypothetical protein
MDVFGSLMDGFGVALQPVNLLVAFVGVLIGTVIGMLPGIGPINGIAILIPISFALGLEPTAMLILFAGIYYGSQYGNSISTILLNVPGTASAGRHRARRLPDGAAGPRRPRAGDVGDRELHRRHALGGRPHAVRARCCRSGRSASGRPSTSRSWSSRSRRCRR